MDNKFENNNTVIPKSDGQTGYTIPENYFDGIEDDIFIKLAEEKFSKKIDFEIPDNYFEAIDDKINTKIKPLKKGKVISLQQSVLKYAAMAVAACFLLFLGINYVNTDNKTDNTILASDIEIWFEESLGADENSELALVFENDFDLSENDIVFNDDLIEDYFDNISDVDLLNEIE